MKKNYVVPEVERLSLNLSMDVLSVSTSSKTGEGEVPDIPIDIDDL